jgi:hypothetical protein
VVVLDAKIESDQQLGLLGRQLPNYPEGRNSELSQMPQEEHSTGSKVKELIVPLTQSGHKFR